MVSYRPCASGSREIRKGDRIITYSKGKREYIIGTVTEPHFYDLTIVNPDYPNTIRVNWESSTVERDLLTQAAKNSLGSVLTVFRVDQWGNEIERLIENSFLDPTELNPDDEENEIIEDLVGGLLQAMEYNVQISPKGPDGGVDVLAYKDAFGFEKPIIKVQVKPRKSSATAPEVQQLLGANPIDANSLFVSTGDLLHMLSDS